MRHQCRKTLRACAKKRGAILSRERMAPYPRNARIKEDLSFEKSSFSIPVLLRRSNYSASCIAFAAATAFACASAEHCS